MTAAEEVLAVVQQRLQRERRAAGARRAAWGSVIVALLVAVVHLWIRPVSTSGALAAVALPWLLAALQSLATRPGRAECAQWADRHLDSRSGFATLQELSRSHAIAPTAAIAHLEAWLDETARRGLERLRQLPLATSLAKPLAAALVCVSLAVALLQIPTQPLAARHETAPVASMTAAERSEFIARPGVRPPDVASVTRAPDGDDARIDAEARRGGNPTATPPSRQQADSRDDSAMQPGEPPPGARTAAGATTTGREAGDSVDTGGDAGLVAPWQGDLVARLREIAATQTPPAGRAESTETAEYDAVAMSADALPAGTPAAGAAAPPPPATSTLLLGPAEQAYLRAYRADTGARR